jgi:hypothetical protein
MEFILPVNKCLLTIAVCFFHLASTFLHFSLRVCNYVCRILHLVMYLVMYILMISWTTRNFIPVGCILLRNVHVRIRRYIPAIATNVSCWCYYLSLYHYMFRPPRAILRRIQYITLFVCIHLRMARGGRNM